MRPLYFNKALEIYVRMSSLVSYLMQNISMYNFVAIGITKYIVHESPRDKHHQFTTSSSIILLFKYT